MNLVIFILSHSPQALAWGPSALSGTLNSSLSRFSNRWYASDGGTDPAAEVYSTVTDFARFLGWSTSHPRLTAM